MPEILYRRVVSEGGRVSYEPAEVEILGDAYPVGVTLVSVQREGGSRLTSWMRGVDPAFAEVLAVGPTIRAAMIAAMHEANEMHPKGNRHSEPWPDAKQQAAYNTYREMGGYVPLVFQGCSLNDVVDAGIRAMEAEMHKARSTPQ